MMVIFHGRIPLIGNEGIFRRFGRTRVQMDGKQANAGTSCWQMPAISEIRSRCEDKIRKSRQKRRYLMSNILLELILKYLKTAVKQSPESVK